MRCIFPAFFFPCLKCCTGTKSCSLKSRRRSRRMKSCNTATPNFTHRFLFIAFISLPHVRAPKAEVQSCVGTVGQGLRQPGHCQIWGIAHVVRQRAHSSSAAFVCAVFEFAGFVNAVTLLRRYNARVEKAEMAAEGHWEYVIECVEDHVHTSCKRRSNDFKALWQKLGADARMQSSCSIVPPPPPPPSPPLSTQHS